MIENDETDDPPDPPDPNNVPGLEDDDGDDDDLTDDDGDNDIDGGTQPPPPGMSLGGIIEDFIDDMDSVQQDLFEDYMLVIDDGLDLA